MIGSPVVVKSFSAPQLLRLPLPKDSQSASGRTHRAAVSGASASVAVVPSYRTGAPTGSSLRYVAAELELTDWRRRVQRAVRPGAARARPGRRATESGARGAMSCSDRIRRARCCPTTRCDAGGIGYWPYDPALRFELAAAARRARADAAGADARRRDDPAAAGRPHRASRVRRRSGSTCGGCISTAAASSSRCATARPERRATAAGATCSTRPRAPTSAATQSSLVIDLNFAYHPSCRYNPEWVCPLAPRRQHHHGPGRRPARSWRRRR